MEVLNPRSSLLSNYEVLTLLQELESTHLQRSKAAVRIKKEEEAAGAPPTHTNPIPDISENIRTIQVEAIQYLTSDHLPTASQTPNGISQLVKDLSPYDLTKAEKLQIVNLTPTTPVELYVVRPYLACLTTLILMFTLTTKIVEELEDRLGDSMDSILTTVETSLSTKPTTANGTRDRAKQPLFLKDTVGAWDDVDADAIIDDLDFMDHGEGAGIEGDLDVEDD
ncbi:hypothetical protein D9756_004951 [Leucocoprinus leucothites]|uniref:DNA-directed RNA polymerase III subunit RPC9 n=1 Tax=Leucocoprinus leucothites TaxID=201217 RepID=A0A8H5G8X2_9AGAR|nr:hypothetical protein D9756_004951 [Leucoagaricus leucothites]